MTMHPICVLLISFFLLLMCGMEMAVPITVFIHHLNTMLPQVQA